MYKSRLPRAFVAAVLVSACSQGSSPATPSSSKDKDKPYEDVGAAKPGSYRCEMKKTSAGFQCVGYMDEKIVFERPVSKSTEKWLRREDNWVTSPAGFVRRRSPNGDMVEILGQSIRLPGKMRLKSLAEDGRLVVARFTTRTREGAQDPVYMIPAGASFESTYYMMIDKFDYDPNTPPPEDHGGRRIATWRVFGVFQATPQSDRIFREVSHGTFRWCADTHTVTDDAAQFVTCPGAHEVDIILPDSLFGFPLLLALQQAIVPRSAESALDPSAPIDAVLQQLLGGASMLKAPQLATMKQVWRAQDSDPMWMMCGAGCCTADEGVAAVAAARK